MSSPGTAAAQSACSSRGLRLRCLTHPPSNRCSFRAKLNCQAVAITPFRRRHRTCGRHGHLDAIVPMVLQNVADGLLGVGALQEQVVVVGALRHGRVEICCCCPKRTPHIHSFEQVQDAKIRCGGACARIVDRSSSETFSGPSATAARKAKWMLNRISDSSAPGRRRGCHPEAGRTCPTAARCR